MRTLVHLSDIHFGSVDNRILKPLIETVTEIKPDLVTVSGDLTQRARSNQFKEARAFLDSLPKPQIVVPGNHDVPLYNIFNRFVRPLAKFRSIVTRDLHPEYADEEIVVLGVNTARSLTIKGGRINKEQIAGLREKFCKYGNSIIKIVVTHHPLDLPVGYDEQPLAGRSRMAMKALEACGVDMFLSGHLHISHTGQSAMCCKINKYSSLVIQAGTAASTRGRGEANSFNVIRIADPSVSIERLEWQPESGTFFTALIEEFQRNADGWKSVSTNS